MAGRPIIILDTSVFIQDALSPEQTGAASQLLAITPTIAHVVMCSEARAELRHDRARAPLIARYEGRR